MKNIPCIDSNFLLWSWEERINDETSDLYVQNAYEAITTGGYLYNFNTSVWNSMVLLLQKIYKEGNLTWDNLYGGIDSIRIYFSDDDRILTAQRWNAIVHNISKQISTVWPWENEPAKRGYLGRRFMHANDFLYGWYLEELYSEINRLIKICKGEADLAKLVINSKSKTGIDADFTGAIAGVMGYVGIVKAPISAQLLGCQSGTVAAYKKSHTLYQAALSKILPGLMQVICNEHTKHHANLYAAQAGALLYQDMVKTNFQADLSAVPYVGKLSTGTAANTFVYANLIGWRPLRISSKSISRDKVHSVLIAALPYLLGTKSKSESQAQASLQVVEPKDLTAHILSGCSVKAELQYNKASLLSAPVEVETLLNARLRACRSGTMYALNESGTTDSAELLAPPASTVEAVARSTSGTNADLTSAVAAQMDVSFRSESSESADITLAIPVCMEASERSQSKELAELIYTKPVNVVGVSQESTIIHVDLNKIPIKNLESAEKVKSRTNAQLVRRQVETISVLVQSGTFCYADLTIYKEPGTWRDPEQRGSNLRIWNAHPQWQEGTTVHLDAGGIYYDPVQVGNNVYIRSIDSMKEKETKDG